MTIGTVSPVLTCAVQRSFLLSYSISLTCRYNDLMTTDFIDARVRRAAFRSVDSRSTRRVASCFCQFAIVESGSRIQVEREEEIVSACCMQTVLSVLIYCNWLHATLYTSQ
jgi:hypothetical protein